MSVNGILSIKGTKRNPYTIEEYSMFRTNEWPGGWVRNSSDGSIDYRNSNGYVTQTITKGQSANPYTEYEYDYKLNQEMNWPGGWVVNTGLSIRYINAYNEQGESFSLGKQRNPYYDVEFNNLYATNDWHGGWVEYESGGKVYINAQGEEDEDPAASGSGCGSGCGSGSSDIVGYGNLIAGYANVSISGNIATLTWGSGTFNAIDDYPSLSCESPTAGIIPALWSAPFMVLIGGLVPYEIPHYYRC